MQFISSFEMMIEHMLWPVFKTHAAPDFILKAGCFSLNDYGRPGKGFFFFSFIFYFLIWNIYSLLHVSLIGHLHLAG